MLEGLQATTDERRNDAGTQWVGAKVAAKLSTA